MERPSLWARVHHPYAKKGLSVLRFAGWRQCVSWRRARGRTWGRLPPPRRTSLSLSGLWASGEVCLVRQKAKSTKVNKERRSLGRAVGRSCLITEGRWRRQPSGQGSLVDGRVHCEISIFPRCEGLATKHVEKAHAMSELHVKLSESGFFPPSSASEHRRELVRR